jgi:hypothetical protein
MLPSLTIQWPAAGHGASGGLRPIAVPPAAEVTMELSNPRSLSLVLRSPRRTVLAVPATGLLLITATQTTVDGIDGDMNPRPAGAWRVRLRDGAAPVAVQGRGETLALSVTLPAADGERLPLFSGGAIVIDAIDFSTQDEFGRRVSAVAAGGRLELPDVRPNEPFVLAPASVVTLQELDRFAMRGISVDSRRRLQVEMEGIAGTVWTESGAIRTDHRVTAFALLRRHRAWTVAGILLWMLATGIAIRGCRSVAARV